MAPKSKKRTAKIDNKLKLEGLQLTDVVCSICQSILIEPVTLPCYHDFCKICFNGSIENNSLCCPLCRLRIGSWLRTCSKQDTLVNQEFWKFIQYKFPEELDAKRKGQELDIPSEQPLLRLSAPGEIRSEYEAELSKLRAEQLQHEKKQLQESEILIKKIQDEEDEAHKKYIERLKQDEILALQMQKEDIKISVDPTPQAGISKSTTSKCRLKDATIDGYLSKLKPMKVKPEHTDNSFNTSLIVSTTVSINATSPELVPNFMYQKPKSDENTASVMTTVQNEEECRNSEKTHKINNSENIQRDRTSFIQTLPVSLPYTGPLRVKCSKSQERSVGNKSVDFEQQELWYFKPIEAKIPASRSICKEEPLKVPGRRVGQKIHTVDLTPPSRDQYLEGLCRLRNISLENNLPSAFVITHDLLRFKKDESLHQDGKTSPIHLRESKRSCSTPVNNVCDKNKRDMKTVELSKINSETSLRRTRSMGSISKGINETTPKKAKIKDRKASSERKPYLRSDSKKLNSKNDFQLPIIPESLDNNNVSLVVKNLSSPLKNCDVKKILEEQLRIEKIIKQEKSDFDLARRVEAELNGRRVRRAAVKRQMTLTYLPAKKLKA